MKAFSGVLNLVSKYYIPTFSMNEQLQHQDQVFSLYLHLLDVVIRSSMNKSVRRLIVDESSGINSNGNRISVGGSSSPTAGTLTPWSLAADLLAAGFCHWIVVSLSAFFANFQKRV
jgi:hypothetical protein